MRLNWSRHAGKRAAQGALAAVGAPLGWLLIEWWSGTNPLASYLAQPGLYAYMLFGTVLVLSAFGFYVGNFEASFQALSERDPLTGAFNRRYFERRLQEERLRFQRTQQPFALASLDIDHFKRINDGYGHAAGDDVLKHFVAVVDNSLRALDCLARVGGEEFQILMPATELLEAEQAMLRLLALIRQSSVAVGTNNHLNVTVSIGVTCIGADDDLVAVLARADQAMYAAKQAGRDRLIVA